ncbi:hypothetical protein ACHQM5_008211 [Ranunculus cassubicifolius]
MEDSWRARPIIQGGNHNICCPSCSISHFPYCPHPISSNQPMFMNSIRPPPMISTDVYNQISMINHRGGNTEFSDRSIKRMRMSVEDERRLSLIRDHGAPDLGQNRFNGYSYGNWQARPVGNGHQESRFENREFGRRDQDFGLDRNHNMYFNGDRRGEEAIFTSQNLPELLYSGYTRNSNATAGFPGYVDTSKVQQEGVANHYSSFLNPQESRNMYGGNESRQVQAKGFNQENEFSRADVGDLSQGSIYESSQSFHVHGQLNDVGRQFDVKHPPVGEFKMPVASHNLAMSEQLSGPKVNQLRPYLPPTGNSMASFGHMQGPTSRAPGVYPPLPPLPPPSSMGLYPPLPPLPPPSLPMEPPGPPPAHLQPRAPPSNIPLASSNVLPISDVERQPFQPKSLSPDKPKIIDASSLFKRPNRESRPDHIVVILRGLPGSGKSYIAKMLRDLEVENGAKAPRIHSMDDYFMTEVEKVEESLVKGKKRVTKKVMEYCYEPEMEELYRSSMLKAFKKTLEDGVFTFIIVDDRNLRVADFAQFWAIAKRSGYEVYLLEAVYKDPVGCAARNIHGFTSDGIQKMAKVWEEAPSLYLRLDIQSLFHGDDLKGNEIQEVDMDMDDVACDEGQNNTSPKKIESPNKDGAFDGTVKEERDDGPEVKQLGKSKWSQDVDEDDIDGHKMVPSKASNALSGLIQAYTKGDKSVHWGDQIGNTGFSIGACKKANVLSLVIGPGAGYNMKTNPLPEEENASASDISWQSKKRSVFEQQLRAERASERESFKKAVDRRRQRIGGFEMDDGV